MTLRPVRATTGERLACVRTHAGGDVFDMSGNLKEWVRAGGRLELRGGAYNNVSDAGDAPGLQCDGVSPTDPNTEIHLPSVGFRCCDAGNLFQ